MFPKPPLWVIFLEVQMVCFAGYLAVKAEGFFLYILAITLRRIIG